MNGLILEITKIALEKNQRQKNTIFMYYYGHVNNFSIQVYSKGWSTGAEEDFSKDLYMNTLTEEENIKGLEEILEYLKGLEV